MQAVVLVGGHGAIIPHQLHSSTLTELSSFSLLSWGHGNSVLHGSILKARDPGSLSDPLGGGSMSLFVCLSRGKNGSRQWGYRSANARPSPLPNALRTVCLRPVSEQLKYDAQLSNEQKLHKAIDSFIAHPIMRLRKIRMHSSVSSSIK